MAGITKEQPLEEDSKDDSVEAQETMDVGLLAARELIPKPTKDPNDPLVSLCLRILIDEDAEVEQNWSKFEKYTTYLTVCFFTFLATVNASNFTVAVTVLAERFHQNSTRTGFLVVSGTPGLSY